MPDLTLRLVLDILNRFRVNRELVAAQVARRRLVCSAGLVGRFLPFAIH